jgi:hypothetical protein
MNRRYRHSRKVVGVKDETNGAVEWIRTTTVLLPPAPQAGASASSATTAFRFSEVIIDGPKNFAQLYDRVFEHPKESQEAGSTSISSGMVS